MITAKVKFVQLDVIVCRVICKKLMIATRGPMA